MGGDSPTAQQAAGSAAKRGRGRGVKRSDRHGNRGQIKIQEDRSPKTTRQVRNFAPTSFAFYPKHVP
jgi:hypothetical protein